MLYPKCWLRRKTLLFLLIFYCRLAIAQTETNTAFSTRMNYIFQLLEKNRVPNGLLLDYAMEFTNLSNYSGAALADSNKVVRSEFWEIYNTLYLSRIHSSGLTIQNPAAVDSVWFSQRQYGKIVLAGLFYNYSRFKDNAVQQNLITIQSEQVRDKYVNGVWQNPYQSEKVFAVSPSAEIYEGKNLQVVLPANLWQSNTTLTNISIDLNDGLGYRTVTIGQPLTLSYTDTGLKIWKYRVQSGGLFYYSHSQVRIKNAVGQAGCPNCRFGQSIRETIPFEADEAFLGKKATGSITIHYRDADFGLRRPLIVAEGFDAGHITKPELDFGETNINTFFEQNVLTSNSDLEDIIVNNPDYDIVYVDWRNGTDWLQRNGFLLETIIRWVNNNKEPLPGGGFADNVILGMSMGGVISRWALRDMEVRLGQQHHTDMFISMDAPQQGANVPTAYQHLAKHLRDFYIRMPASFLIENFQLLPNGLSPSRVLKLADEPASRQMLINYINTAGNVDNSQHTTWQNELRTLGYPTQNNIRNIAISNGMECGTTQPFPPGAVLLSLNGKANTRFLTDVFGSLGWAIAGTFINPVFYVGIIPGRNEIKYEFVMNAQPNQGQTQAIYFGKVSYKKKVLWIIPIDIVLTQRSRNNNSTLLPMDYYGGGEINTRLDISNTSFQNALVKFNMAFSHIPTFSFVPTPSSLDIGLNNIVLTNADYLARYIGGAPPAPPRNSPFLNFVTAFNNQQRNEQHTGFFPRNGDWLAAELSGPFYVTNCSAICGNANITVTGPPIICTAPVLYTVNNFPVGAVANWQSIPAGMVNIAPIGNGSQANVTRISSGYFTLRVTLTMGVCGSLDVNSASIRSGGFSSSDYPVSGPSSACTNSIVSFSTNTLPTATSYTWFWPATNWSYISGQNTPNLTLQIGSTPGSGQVGVRVANACDAGGSPGLKFVQVNSCGFAFTVAPNPAGDQVTVDATDKSSQASASSAQHKIYKIEIIDQTGNKRREFEFKQGITISTLNISGLPTGLYTIRAYNGTVWSGIQLLKN